MGEAWELADEPSHSLTRQGAHIGQRQARQAWQVRLGERARSVEAGGVQAVEGQLLQPRACGDERGDIVCLPRAAMLDDERLHTRESEFAELFCRAGRIVTVSIIALDFKELEVW